MSTPTRLFFLMFSAIFWSVLIYSCVATRKSDPVQRRTKELQNTGLFTHPGSGLPLLEAETALLALEWPLLGKDRQNAKLDNLEALVRVCR